MNNDFIQLFRQEYAALLQSASELPGDVANRLRIARDRVADPHVERLLEGVAYLGARVQARLTDEFPELSDGLLNILYPQMLAPFPSCMMVRLAPKPELRTVVRIDAHTPLRTERIDGVVGRFRTAAPVALWPVEIASVQLGRAPVDRPENPFSPDPAGVLRISLRCLGGMRFSELADRRPAGLGPLRLHLAAAATAMKLHRLICNHASSVAFAASGSDGIDAEPVFRRRDAIVPGGFAPDDALIPWPEAGFSGFRLLREYFAFPDKFLCVDIDGIGERARTCSSGMLDILIHLDDLPPDMEALGAGDVALGCVPAVNLFPQRCEPIDLDWSRTEYRVDPNRTDLASTEIWSVERVRETRADGTSRNWPKLFRTGSPSPTEPESGRDAIPAGYLPITRPAGGALGGTETFLSVSLPGFDPRDQARSRLSVEALCTNRDVPGSPVFGRGIAALSPETGINGVDKITALTLPTPTLRPSGRDRRAWQFISHLSSNAFPLLGGDDGARTMRDILALYDLRRTADTRDAIDSLIAIASKPGVARLPGAWPRFCQGLDVSLLFAPQGWRNGGLFLLASVIERFLCLHATVNSFVRTRVMLRDHPDPVAQWPARSGTRTLL